MTSQFTRRIFLAATVTCATLFMSPSTALAAPDPCPAYVVHCIGAETAEGAVTLEAADVESTDAIGVRRASNAAPPVPQYRWRLRSPCQVTDPVAGGCLPGGNACPVVPDRLI